MARTVGSAVEQSQIHHCIDQRIMPNFGHRIGAEQNRHLPTTRKSGRGFDKLINHDFAVCCDPTEVVIPQRGFESIGVSRIFVDEVDLL